MSHRGADFRKVLVQNLIVSPLVSVVFVNPACQLRRGANRNDKPDQLATREIYVHAFHDCRFATRPGSRYGFLAAGRCSVVDRLDNSAVNSAESLPEFLRHICAKKLLRIFQTSFSANWIDALRDFNASRFASFVAFASCVCVTFGDWLLAGCLPESRQDEYLCLSRQPR